MKSDYQIAQDTPMQLIRNVAAAMGIPAEKVLPHGHYKAKIDVGGFDEGRIAHPNWYW